MADLFLKKTLNASLGPDFVKHKLWFLCRSTFINRIAIFDYDFRSIHGASDPNYYVSSGHVGSIVIEPQISFKFLLPSSSSFCPTNSFFFSFFLYIISTIPSFQQSLLT